MTAVARDRGAGAEAGADAAGPGWWDRPDGRGWAGAGRAGARPGEARRRQTRPPSCRGLSSRCWRPIHSKTVTSLPCLSHSVLLGTPSQTSGMLIFGGNFGLCLPFIFAEGQT